MKITETEIIHKYLRGLTFNNKSSLKLKDDIFYEKKKKFIISTDTYIENKHFIKSKNPKNFISKIFRSSISDIICKGVQPRIYFLSLSLNKISKIWLKNLTNILRNESKKYGLFLGGGDIVKSKELSFTLTILGYVKKKPILRSNALILDDVYVTGNLGDSYLGLLFFQNKIKYKKFKNYFKNSFIEPKIPYKFSKTIGKFANSSMDISDGLIKDLKSLCYASNCGAHFLFENIPFSNQAIFLQKKKLIKLINILSKGDDYQLLFTANKKLRKKISLSAFKTQTKVTRIGTITSKKGITMSKGGNIVNLTGGKSGFIHSF